jgi:hypothetical protein
MNRTLLVVLAAHLLGQAQAQADLVGLSRAPEPRGLAERLQNEPVLLESGLPVLELVSFEAASKDHGTVEVQFATVSERPEETFHVERSGDLIHWDLVAQVQGQGHTDSHTPYTITDESPINGVSYYRLLAQVNGDWAEISDRYSIRHEGVQDLTIHGDPRPGRFSVMAQGTLSDMAIMNNRGQFMTLELNMDGDRVSVNAELLENGTYYFQAMVDGIPVMRPIVIRGGNIVGG